MSKINTINIEIFNKINYDCDIKLIISFSLKKVIIAILERYVNVRKREYIRNWIYV